MDDISISYSFKSSRARRGAIAEKQLMKALQANGYTVSRLHLGKTDLIARKGDKVIRIEVKFSSLNKDNKYHATTIKRNATDHRHSDVIVLLCQLPYSGGQCVPFVIPVSAQGDKHHICITSNPLTYSGYYAQFRNAWDNI